MRTLLVTALLAAQFSSAFALTPKLGAAAQVAPSAFDKARNVLLVWQPLEGFQLAPAHAIYRKPGAADAVADFSLVAIVQPTADVSALTILLDRADAAGFDLGQVELAVDGLLESPMPGASLASKLSAVLLANLDPARQQLLHDILPGLHPPIAMALGRAFLATVPDGEISTFEIRVFDPVTQRAREVVASLTAGPEPVFVPAPGQLSERVEASARGHLRVLLRWCTPVALAHKALHVSGYNVYRASRAAWLATEGVPPPLAPSRAEFLAAVDAGRIVQVNRTPILPPSQFPCFAAIPDDVFFVADDHNSEELMRFEEGGEPFQPGEQVTYYAAPLDHFREVGEPSPGLEVTVCDRLPPLVPRQLRVENRPGYDSDAQLPLQHLALSWDRDDPAEVTHYWVYRWNSHDEALRHAANPSISNLLARIPNAGAGDRMKFLDDGSEQLPTAPPFPALPADAGRTFWYTVRAEDGTACPSPAGHGNLSGPCGAAFGVLRQWAPLDNVGGRLTGRCCEIETAFTAATGQLGRREAVGVHFAPNDARIVWAEVREGLSGTRLRRYHLENAWPSEFPPLDLSAYGNFRLEVRFGTHAGHVSAWSPGLAIGGSVAIPRHIWTATLECVTTAWPCDGGFVDPVDPDSGSVSGVCGELNPTPGAIEWRVYRRTDGNHQLVQIDSGKFPDNAWCDSGTPSVPARLCYFAQGFDQDGNPSAISRLGCVDSLGTESLPKPEITRAAVLTSLDQPAVLIPAAVDWFCPPHGIERFELALRPPPPGVNEIVWLPVAGAQEAIGTDHGIHRSPRIPAGFGSGGPDFSQGLTLLAGQEYRVRVRAIVTRTDDNAEVQTAYGPWSDEVPLSLVSGVAAQGPQVPWPARPVPPIQPGVELRAEYDTLEEANRVEIGVVTADGLVNPGTGTLGPVVHGESLEPFLTIPLPYVIYRHEVSPGHRGEMTQITPLIQGFLGTAGGPPASPTFTVTDDLVLVKRRQDEPAGPFRIWIRDTQPAIRGKSYRYTIVLHREDREIAGVLASNTAQIPD